MRRYSIAALLCFVVALSAEDIYIANDALGGDTGADAENAHGALWYNTSGNWGAGDGKVSAGDTVYLVSTIGVNLTNGGSGTIAEPIRITFDTGAKLSAGYWDDYVVPTNAKAPQSGAFFLSGVSNTIISGGTIEATNTGPDRLYTNYGFAGVYMTSVRDIVLSNLTIRDMYAHIGKTNDDWGFCGGWGVYGINCASNITIANCNITSAWYGISLACSSGGGAAGNWAIRSNVVYGCAVGVAAVMANTGSELNGVAIVRNVIAGSAHWDENTATNYYDWGYGCAHRKDGVKTWARFDDANAVYQNLTISSNVIGPFMVTNSARAHSGWYCQDGGLMSNVVVSFNLFLGGSGESMKPFIATGNDTTLEPGWSNQFLVYNNTFASVYEDTVGDPCLKYGRHTTNQMYWNNAYYGYSRFIYGYSSDGSTVTLSDYNSFYEVVPSVDAFQEATTFWTWAEWQAAGKDANSTTNAPGFRDTANAVGPDGVWWTSDDGFRPSSGSPLVNAGSGGVDIGAYEYGRRLSTTTLRAGNVRGP